MDSVLQSIVTVNKKTQKELGDQTKLLERIAATQDKMAGVAAKKAAADARAARRNKRYSGDRDIMGQLAKDNKKGKGGVVGGLKGGIANLAKFLTSSGVITAAIATAVGYGIYKYVTDKEFRKTVNVMTEKLWTFVKKNVLEPTWNWLKPKLIEGMTNAWEWIKKKGPEISSWLNTNIIDPMVQHLIKSLRGIFGNSQTTNVGEMLENQYNNKATEILTGRKRTRGEQQLTTKANKLIQKIDLPQSQGGYKRGSAEHKKAMEEYEMAMELREMFISLGNMRAQRDRSLAESKKTDEELPLVFQKDEYRDRHKKKAEVNQQNIEALLNKLKLKQGQMDLLGLTGMNDGSIYEHRQAGGPINVPGTGSGDKVPMMLPGGSFVMNRNAAAMLQSGGMVPTLLEPGEKVFGPGQWGPMEQMMNTTFGRFKDGGPVGKDSQQKQEMTEKLAGSARAKFATGEVKPGGKMTFIGDGSGFTGEIKLIDGAGKTVAQIGGVSGVSRTAKTTQAQRLNPGFPMSHYPIPDGTYPTETKTTRHPGQKVGQWSAWVNNSSGNIGGRGQIFTHNDIGANGTAGCIGIETGGSRGSENSMKFADIYDKVAPSNVLVNLSSSDGGSYAPGGGGGGGGLMGALSGVANAVSPYIQPFIDLIKSFFGPVGDIIGGAMSGLGNLITGGGNQQGVSTPSEPLTGDSASKAKAMFDYIKSKGYTDAQAKGIVANIQRESSFRLGAVGDSGSSHGLFQWHAGRATRMKSAVPDYATNWKGQIDYALNEHVGPRYKGETANMSAKDAAYWWMNKWEIPADRARGGPNHNKMNGFIDAYGFQKGGAVNTSGSGAYSDGMVKKSRQEFAQEIAAATTPIVVPMPMGGGVREGQGNLGLEAPILQSEDTSIVSMEYKLRRLTMGASI
tara:strand:- start:2316 stop:5024 length:2709 start_codon:yes stop_codon:yes gene_type:complete